MSSGAPAISDALALGFDVGGQSVKAVAVDHEGRVLQAATAPTGIATTPASLADALATLRDQLLAATGHRGAFTAGCGVAGALARSGELRGAPHLPALCGVPLAPLLAARLGCDVALHNDADCAAIAEGWIGAARGARDFLAAVVGTGVGSGLVLDGALRTGPTGLGCELGHLMVVHRGRACGCGNRGCLEAYASESAARALVAEAPATLRGRVDARRGKRGGGAAEATATGTAALGEDAAGAGEALGGASLAEGGASLADGGASALAMAWRVAAASVALGGGAAASVPARSASALYWA